MGSAPSHCKWAFLMLGRDGFMLVSTGALESIRQTPRSRDRLGKLAPKIIQLETNGKEHTSDTQMLCLEIHSPERPVCLHHYAPLGDEDGAKPMGF